MASKGPSSAPQSPSAQAQEGAAVGRPATAPGEGLGGQEAAEGPAPAPQVQDPQGAPAPEAAHHEAPPNVEDPRAGGRKAFSAPLPGAEEALVGVVESQWPLSSPQGLLPGDIILRIGRRGQPGMQRAPFAEGLATVSRSIQRRAASGDAVVLQVLRGSSKLELLVPLSKPSEGSARADEGQAEPVEGVLGEGGLGRILRGVVLAEGKHSRFAPLAARTEHNILRLERMKAYGLPLEQGGNGGARRGGRGSSRRLAKRGSRTREREGAAALAWQSGPPGEEDSSSSSGSGSERSAAGEESEVSEFSLSPRGSLLTVAASVLPSDPSLKDEPVEGFSQKKKALLSTRLGPRGPKQAGDGDVSDAFGDAGLFSMSRGPGTGPGPQSGSPQEEEVSRLQEMLLQQEKDSSAFRLYQPPTSPVRRFLKHLSLSPPEDDTSGPLAQPHAGPKGAPFASFQISRTRIPETLSEKPSHSQGLAQGPVSLFTILVLPGESPGSSSTISNGRGNKATEKNSTHVHRRFADVNSTVERATRWFSAVKSSGVALGLMSAQTEVLPLRLGGMDSEKLAKVAQYGKWIVKTGDSARGDHVSVLRAVRLWLVPSSEVELTLAMASQRDDNCPDWGLQLAQTSQGLVYVSSVASASAADKAGVQMLLRMAEAKKQLLTVARIQSQALIPTMISDDGIDCVDVHAVNEQLILHAHLQTQLQLTFVL